MILFSILLVVELLQGKRVFELGAGIGFTGIVLLKANIGIKHLTMTDYSQRGLDLLQENMDLNNIDPNQGGVCLFFFPFVVTCCF